MTGKVLIADDDVGLIRLLRVAMEQLGLQVRETYDAISALTLAQREPPNLLILDIGMPGGNGLLACEMLNSDRWLSQLPVIILTGQSDDAITERCSRLGAHYVRKGPDAVTAIKQLVTKLLSPVPAGQSPALTQAAIRA